jgi:hypothetical protein
MGRCSFPLLLSILQRGGYLIGQVYLVSFEGDKAVMGLTCDFAGKNEKSISGGGVGAGATADAKCGGY